MFERNYFPLFVDLTYGLNEKESFDCVAKLASVEMRHLNLFSVIKQLCIKQDQKKHDDG